MNLIELLEEKADEILFEANSALARAHLEHYEEAGIEQSMQHLKTLYYLTLQRVKYRNMGPVIDYAEQIAQERFTSGFNLHEVLTAFNVLEETIWKQITDELPPSEFAEALGLVSTALGAGKDVLATTYVSLAAETKAPSLDLLEFSKGT
jgi:hypothetical protein